jgi:hypothetical protein
MSRYPLPTPTTLASEHVSTDARLYATRDDLIADLSKCGHVKPGSSIAEVGVAFGDFSKVLIRTLQPASFSAFDIFKFHEEEYVFGRLTKLELNGLPHKIHYERMMQSTFPSVRIAVYEGDGAANMDRILDASLDLIYIDANHDISHVERDTCVSLRKIKPTGVIIFNDYIMTDHLSDRPYGVVQIANDVIAKQGWKAIRLFP